MNKKTGLIMIVISFIFIISGVVLLLTSPSKKEGSNSNNNEETEKDKDDDKDENGLKKLPLPEATGGERGQLGIDKNINESNIDEYLNRPDSVYRDMRMLDDPAQYENIGGDRFLSGYIQGFEVIPLPYIIPVTGLPKEVGDTYTGETLFRTDENGNYVANYEESMSIIESIFPKDKVIFLMCGGGGYAGMTKNFLISLGWDSKKIYNIGGYWYYDGNNNVVVNKTENGFDFSGVPYHEIKFSELTLITEEKTPEPTPAPSPTPEPTPTTTKGYLDDKYYNNYNGTGFDHYDLTKYKDELTAAAGTDKYDELYEDVQGVAQIYGSKIDEMIENKESFILSVFPGDLCYGDTGENEDVLNNIIKLSTENDFYYYKLGLLVYRQTKLFKTIKYAPTVIVVIKGEVVAYYDAENDDHLKYNQSYEEFKNWITSFVYLKKENN